MSRDPVNLQRGEDPSEAQERKLRKALARAKKKGGQRVRPGDMQGTPRFDQIEDHVQMQPAPGSHSPPPTELSDDTQQGLAAMARQAEGVAAAAGEEGEMPEQKVPQRPKSKDLLMKEAIEARLKPIDIGQFLMNGTVSQTVPIISTESAKLTVVFTTAKEALEVYVDARLSEEAAQIRKLREGDNFTDVEMSQREYLRRQNEWALAVQVKSYQGKEWPRPLRSNGDPDPEAMQLRLQYVRAIPSSVFAMITQNLGWFIERVGDALTSAALGNG